MLSSNDYLGLPIIPRLKKPALRPYNNGEAVPLVLRLANGGGIFHRELEEDLADFLGKEACHVFSAGYLACASAITGFVDRKDIVFADKNLHSSLWSGIQLKRCNL